MAGREMTAWIAGLSFISANLGSLEMMGYAAATYQYGMLVAHAYLIARHPRHPVPGHRDAAVLLHLQDALGAGIPEAALRRTAAARFRASPSR